MKKIKKCKSCNKMPELIDCFTNCNGKYWESQHYVRCNPCGFETKKFHFGSKESIHKAIDEVIDRWNKLMK